MGKGNWREKKEKEQGKGLKKRGGGGGKRTREKKSKKNRKPVKEVVKICQRLQEYEASKGNCSMWREIWEKGNTR